MKLPAHLPSKPTSTARTDEEVRSRIESLALDEHTSNINTPPPRARTLPSRPLLPPNPDANNLDFPHNFESIRYEETVEASSTEARQEPYTSPKQAANGQRQEELSSKTPKRSSPAFSLNRKSLREPVEYLKHQGKQFFRRGSIKDLFPFPYEKSADESRKEAQDVAEEDAKEDTSNTTAKDHQVHQDHLSQEYDDCNHARYHAVGESNKERTCHVNETFNDDKKTHTIDPETVAIKKDQKTHPWPTRTSSKVSPWPLRTSSLDSGITNINIIPPAPKIVIVSSLLLAILDLRSSLDDDDDDVESLKRSNATLSNSSASTLDDAVKNVTMSTEDLGTMSGNMNYFPPWASKCKPDGRFYTQKEIVNVISPELQICI